MRTFNFFSSKTNHTFYPYSYFVCSVRAIIPAANGVENDVPRNPVTQEEDKDVDV